MRTGIVVWLATTLTLAVGSVHAFLIPPIVRQLPVGRLNDTGMLLCYDGTALSACSAANSGAGALYPHQDATIGRDAAVTASVGFAKSGGGAAGFDFTRVCFNGSNEGSATCTGTLVANDTGTASASANTDWACTRDNVTNLMWSLQSRPAWWADAVAPTFPDAGHNSANRCGYSTGWRVPTPRELMSLVHNGMDRPVMIDGNYFPNTWNGEYWTSLADVNYTIGAWTVDFMYGSINDPAQSYQNEVRLVRSISTASLAPLYANADGTVSDPNTGLMWDQCVHGLSGAGCASGTPWTGTWANALASAVTANTVGYKGYADWRVPNKNELASIVNYAAPGQAAIDATVFPGTPRTGTGSYSGHAHTWTSTPRAAVPGTSWAVDFNGGAVSPWYNTPQANIYSYQQLYYLRLVRGGQGFATFDVLNTVRLKVGIVGAGHVSGGAMNCGSAATCSIDVPVGTIITLTASPASNFLGWSGACLGVAVPAPPALPTCTLTVTAATPQVNVDFLDSPLLSFSSGPVDFGTVKVGASSGTQSVNVVNTGTRPLSISGVSMIGDFSVKEGCSGVVLAVNATCLMNLQFAPSLAGLRTGGARVFSNAPENPYTLDLSGTAQGGLLVTSPPSPVTLDFGSTALGARSTPQTVTLFNNGGLATIMSIALTGEYTQTNDCPAVLPSWPPCTISITFAPKAPRAVKPGTLTITTDAGTTPNPLTINLTGIGYVLTTPPPVVKRPDLTPILMLLLD